MPTSPAIQTCCLTKRYDHVVAVDNLDLTIERGEVFGFLGPNGAGKSTTVKLLLGLVKPTAGEIRVLGRSMPKQAREVLPQIGAMVEAPAFYPYLTGRDNLIVLAKMARIEARAVDQALERVALTDSARRPFSSYSMGMKQRLAIAAALLRSPALVLLDEPTAGLDPAGQREIRALIPQLAGEGCTVFLSSHTMPEVQEICDRVGFLRAGRLIRTAPVDQLIHDDSRVVFEIVTADPGRGREILQSQGWVDEVVQADGRLIVSTTAERAADLNRTLVAHGVFATEIRQRERTLEEVFFELVGERVA